MTSMKTRTILAAIVCSLIPFVQAAAGDGINNSPIKVNNIGKYMGRWYEIARFDHRFEKGQTNTSAFYSQNTDGTIKVANTGWKNGKLKTSNGKAKLTNTAGLLRVSFFWPFYSDYRILMLADDYSHALVGGSSDDYLWILARTPQINNSTKKTILKEAERRGYNTSRLIWVDQNKNNSIL